MSYGQARCRWTDGQIEGKRDQYVASSPLDEGKTVSYVYCAPESWSNSRAIANVQ